MKALYAFILWLITLAACAQSEHAWETYLNEVVTADDVGTDSWEETFNLLCELEQHPLDINQATREQLEEFPFLSAQQVEDIVAYLYHYGPMKSLGELQMVKSLDYSRRRLLSFFIYLSESPDKPAFPSLKNIARNGRSELTTTVRMPFYERRGDTSTYQGYPYRHWFRYQLTSGDYVKLGLVGAQDAGEPFFAGRNGWGYDYYSMYLQLRQLGRIEALVIGNYRISLGMGLTINNSFGLGKVSMLQNMGRPANTLRAHSSHSFANYLQGAAAILNVGRGLSVTAFVSYRPMDATLNKDGTAATILTTGYHRTISEMEKKNNLKNTTVGGSLRYAAHGVHASVNAVAVHLNRELKPNTAELYRRNYAQGHDFVNMSTDYGYVTPRLSLNGETAINKDGALATINSLSLQLGSEWSLMALQRFYSYRYTSLYANCFNDGGSVQNESGAYLGLTWHPSPYFRLMAYTDYAYFPWAKYQISLSSHSWDNLLQATYSHSHWTFGGRYRLRLRQRDNADKTALTGRTEHRGRLSVEYQEDTGWDSRTQADFSIAEANKTGRGIMVSQTLGYAWHWLRLNGGIGYFHTDGYDSRIYLYEQSPLYTYSFSQFSGEGIRYWLMVRGNIGKRLSLTAKIGTADYFDRSVIGSSYQQIDQSSQTDLDIQLRWKF